MFALDLFVPILFCVRNIYTDLTRVACANEFPLLSVNILKALRMGKSIQKTNQALTFRKKGRLLELCY